VLLGRGPCDELTTRPEESYRLGDVVPKKTKKQNYLTKELHVSVTVSNQNQGDPNIIKRKKQYSWNIFR